MAEISEEDYRITKTLLLMTLDAIGKVFFFAHLMQLTLHDSLLAKTVTFFFWFTLVSAAILLVCCQSLMNHCGHDNFKRPHVSRFSRQNFSSATSRVAFLLPRTTNWLFCR